MLDNLEILWLAWQGVIIWAITLGVALAVFAAFVRLGFQYAWAIIALGILVYLFN